MRAPILTPIFCLLFFLVAVVVHAQQAVVASPPSGCQNTSSETRVRIGDNHNILIGHVEIDCGDTKLYADQVEVFTDEDRTVATGNVVLSQANNRIAAERAEFNLKTKAGTFHNAWGIATIQPQKQAARRDAQPPVPTGQDTDVYFYGETIEKLGARKYKISNGGFTTCVQPTPRWQLASESLELNLDHYTMLRNAVFTVKGVPLLYTPILYYPTTRENRATGILLPTYGTSTLRGQSIHNAFFWAMDRSQDSTFMHDWFANTGQGFGSEYRYNFGGGSDGNVRAYLLNEHEATYTLDDGTASTLPGTRSYEIQGGASQQLPFGFHARGRVNYFSSLTTMQTLHTNISDASRNQRSYGANLVGVLNGFSINGTFDHSEYFYSASDSSATTGSWPRVTIARIERPLFGSQFYYSVNSEFARLLRSSRVGTVELDSGLTRLDTTPQIRFPFKKWSWFTVNSTASVRDTYYTRSLDLTTGSVADEGLNRRYFEFQSQLVGPTFTRVWNTPDNGYAEKFKHSIEPFLTLGRTTAIDNFNRIVQLEGIDAIVGSTTRYSYGVNNRVYAKRRPAGTSSTAPGQAREIISIELVQSYYTDARAAQYDQQYATSFTGAPPSNFSPIALSVRALPADAINATMRAEFDSRYHSLRTISATGTYTRTNRLTSSVSWSKRAFIKELSGFDDPAHLDQYLTATTNAHTMDNHFGGIYSFNYDLLHSSMLMQRVTGFYNAQCCGLSFEYQAYNLSGVTSIAIPVDHRFFMSFTLAGLGNFSPFNGALSGAPR